MHLIIGQYFDGDVSVFLFLLGDELVDHKLSKLSEEC
jgi:hypothetical protein